MSGIFWILIVTSQINGITQNHHIINFHTKQACYRHEIQISNTMQGKCVQINDGYR